MSELIGLNNRIRKLRLDGNPHLTFTDGVGYSLEYDDSNETEYVGGITEVKELVKWMEKTYQK